MYKISTQFLIHIIKFLVEDKTKTEIILFPKTLHSLYLGSETWKLHRGRLFGLQETGMYFRDIAERVQSNIYTVVNCYRAHFDKDHERRSRAVLNQPPNVSIIVLHRLI